jgi:lipopolysaccharide export LptBFGC system permease protein LptF
MRILQKYFLKEFLSIFLPIEVFFIFIFALSEFFWRFSDIIIHRPQFVDVLHFLSLHIPLWFTQTLPISLMLSTLLSISTFVYDREIIAVKTLGVNTKKFFISWLFIGLLFSIISFFVNDKVATRFFSKAQEVFYTKIKKEKYNKDTLENLFYYISAKDETTYIFIEKYNSVEKEINSFLLQKYTSDGSIKLQIYSPYGKKQNLSLLLFDTVIQKFNNNKLVSETKLYEYDFTLPVDIENFQYDFSSMQLDQFSIQQLKQGIKISLLKGETESVNRIVPEMSYRYAIAFLNFILVLLSISIVQNFASQYGKLTSFLYMLVLLIIYWLLLSFLRTLSEVGVINPYYGVWIPNVLLFILGLVLYNKQ